MARMRRGHAAASRQCSTPARQRSGPLASPKVKGRRVTTATSPDVSAGPSWQRWRAVGGRLVGPRSGRKGVGHLVACRLTQGEMAFLINLLLVPIQFKFEFPN
jgi:hypothetical protein